MDVAQIFRSLGYKMLNRLTKFFTYELFILVMGISAIFLQIPCSYAVKTSKMGLYFYSTQIYHIRNLSDLGITKYKWISHTIPDNMNKTQARRVLC